MPLQQGAGPPVSRIPSPPSPERLCALAAARWPGPGWAAPGSWIPEDSLLFFCAWKPRSEAGRSQTSANAGWLGLGKRQRAESVSPAWGFWYGHCQLQQAPRGPCPEDVRPAAAPCQGDQHCVAPAEALLGQGQGLVPVHPSLPPGGLLGFCPSSSGRRPPPHPRASVGGQVSLPRTQGDLPDPQGRAPGFLLHPRPRFL